VFHQSGTNRRSAQVDSHWSGRERTSNYVQSCRYQADSCADRPQARAGGERRGERASGYAASRSGFPTRRSNTLRGRGKADAGRSEDRGRLQSRSSPTSSRGLNPGPCPALPPRNPAYVRTKLPPIFTRKRFHRRTGDVSHLYQRERERMFASSSGSGHSVATKDGTNDEPVRHRLIESIRISQE
jgi:hypothetical protein